VCFSGDGSLLMNCQELATAAEENVNVKIVLFNNNSLGLVHQQQDLFYGKRVFAADYRARLDFVGLAESLGVRAFDLADDENPRATLARALGERGPCLMHALISADEKVYPMVPPGAANKDMIGEESTNTEIRNPKDGTNAQREARMQQTRNPKDNTERESTKNEIRNPKDEMTTEGESTNTQRKARMQQTRNSKDNTGTTSTKNEIRNAKQEKQAERAAMV
jgi:hypothetical protein